MKTLYCNSLKHAVFFDNISISRKVIIIAVCGEGDLECACGVHRQWLSLKSASVLWSSGTPRSRDAHVENCSNTVR